MLLNSSRDKLALLLQNSVTDVSVGFRPPCSMLDMTSRALHISQILDLIY